MLNSKFSPKSRNERSLFYPLHLVHRGRPRAGARVVEEREPCRRDTLSFKVDAYGRDVLDGGGSQGRILAVEAVIIFGLA